MVLFTYKMNREFNKERIRMLVDIYKSPSFTVIDRVIELSGDDRID